MKDILKDAARLLESCEADFGGCEAYQLLLRCINEQTVKEGGELRPLDACPHSGLRCAIAHQGGRGIWFKVFAKRL